ncbi:MAG TPA: aminoacyl-tRNA hydrolase [Bacteroidales bacterium]|nr:aminoacyl-tRNA hydrolase [Bacteroidales bacterium]HOH22388.1 aminoacyl-tRNA hydrolase [Bacteroidales bacterium]HPZ03051.1 aminoacyl-tRNA hydrolase [Bacteroidales bacterium]HQB75016.1 aminoacyl-tRNA hydrolase [Bacteroidales bacterium]
MNDQKKVLVFGLGNPEDKYAGTRHNIGFEVAYALGKRLEVTFKQERYGMVARGKWKGRTIVIIMPTTYMNLSGNAVRYWMEQEKVTTQQIMVIADDIDLPVAQLRIRPKGGGGSHNGLNHIIEVLGNGNYPRLRFGIGKNYPIGYQVEYVLGKFEPEERPEIDKAVDRSVDICLSFATAGLQRTMNQYNQKENKEKENKDNNNDNHVETAATE